MRHPWIAPLAALSLLCGCPPSQRPKKIPPAPSDAPWMRLLKEHGLALHPAPGWLEARLAYDLRPGCALSYATELTEQREVGGQAKGALPRREEARGALRLLPVKEGLAELSLRRTPLVTSGAPLSIEHLGEEEGPLPLTSSPRELSGGAQPLWAPAGEEPGPALFFPVLPGETVPLGARWEIPLPEDPPESKNPWRPAGQASARLDALYTLEGERVALISVEWSRQGSSSPQGAEAPFLRGEERGLATYLWLADRGWPLLAEVFVKSELARLSPDAPPEEQSFTFLGRAYLADSCDGPALR